MGDNTGIEWADATWNPVVGCQLVSPGCTNCYAMEVAARLLDGNCRTPHYAGTTQRVKGVPIWTGKVSLAPDSILTQPLRWARPRRVFVNSMGDVFADGVEWEWVAQVFGVMAAAQHHTFLVLTKRPSRAKDVLGDPSFWDLVNSCAEIYAFEFSDPHARRKDDPRATAAEGDVTQPLPNVWLGVSVEDQRRADERVPVLLDTPAAVRWVSAEPLLGPVDFRNFRDGPNWDESVRYDALSGVWRTGPRDEEGVQAERLDWVVAGGESGRGARPAHPNWFRSLRDQCAGAGVPFFFKQWGEWDEGAERVGKARAGRLLDGVTHDAYPEAQS